jgi:hypothetical protein
MTGNVGPTIREPKAAEAKEMDPSEDPRLILKASSDKLLRLSRFISAKKGPTTTRRKEELVESLVCLPNTEMANYRLFSVDGEGRRVLTLAVMPNAHHVIVNGQDFVHRSSLEGEDFSRYLGVQKLVEAALEKLFGWLTDEDKEEFFGQERRMDAKALGGFSLARST